MWFPSNYVEEMESADESADSNRLGRIQKGSVELAGATIGECRIKRMIIHCMSSLNYNLCVPIY